MAIVQCIVSPALLADTITVNTHSDDPAMGCTLREAIASANTNTAVGGCAKGDGIDLIQFSGMLGGTTLSLMSGELNPSSRMGIYGPVGGMEIYADGTSRVFNIDTTAFAMRYLTISGGLFFNSTTALLSNVTISDNSADSGAGLYINGSAEHSLIWRCDRQR